MRKRIFWFALLLTVATAAQAEPQGNERLIVTAPKPYAKLVADIIKMGGSVKEQYQYVDALAVDLPSSALPALRDLVGEDAISKDVIITAPKPRPASHKNVKPVSSGIYASAPAGQGTRIFPASQAAVPSDKAYDVNFKNLNVRQFHRVGITGRNITVAVIDSGLRPGYMSLETDNSVIGGENLVPDGPGGQPLPSYSSPGNDPHGTFVAGLISANARFLVPATASTFIHSMDTNFPGALEKTGTSRYLTVLGAAPESRLYLVRVFGTNAFAGAPKSRIMTAIEHVIKLREMFDQGLPGGLNIKVCNLSVGTSTIYAGQTPLEQLIDQLLAKDIVPVVAAGDGGPSSLTISSPATSFSALAVGASSPAANERLWRDVSCGGLTGPDCADSSARPFSGTQTAWFSSRGPTADGRTLPGLLAPGVGVLSQGCGGDDGTGACIYNPNSVDLASATSFSAPIVSGIAALLRQSFPHASATQIWNALINGANDSLLSDGSTVLDQGNGVVDAGAASNLLDSGKASDKLPPHEKADSSVKHNIEKADDDISVFHGTVRQSFKNLKPGQRAEVFYEIDENTSQINIDLSKIRLGAIQNPDFGDDVFISVQSAKTSSGAFGDYFDPPFSNPYIYDDTSIVIPHPEPGIVRITVMGDTTNASPASTDIMVTSSKDPQPKTSANDDIRGGDNLVYTVDIPQGVAKAEFQLRWNGDWEHYPTNDLDMYLYDPTGTVDQRGATLRNPEDVSIGSPMPGTWTILIQGFAVPTKKDRFELSVIIDGKVIKAK